MTVKPRRMRQRGRLPAAFPPSPVWPSSPSSGQRQAGAHKDCMRAAILGYRGVSPLRNHTPYVMDILPRDGGSTEVLLHVSRVSPLLTNPDLDGNTSATCSRHLDLPEGAPEPRWGLDTGSTEWPRLCVIPTQQGPRECLRSVGSGSSPPCYTGLVTKITDGKSYRP